MNTKRFISIALTVLMLLTTCGTVFAAEPISFAADKVTQDLVVGNTFEYNVNITDTNPGFTVGRITVEWDGTAFELISVDYGIAPDAGSPTDDDENPVVSISGTYPVTFGNDLAKKNYTATGALFTMKFKILSGATAKEYPVKLSGSESDFLNKDMEKVPFSMTDGSITLTAKPVPATSVAVDKATVSIDEGQTETVTATVKPDDTTDTLEWKSADTSIATVADGVITGVKEGTTTVTATAGSKSATVSVTVTKPAHTHTWVAGTPVAPTCTEKGYTPYTCSECGETKQADEKDALGHDWVAGTPVDPTCSEKGYTPYTCSRCSETKQDDFKDTVDHTWVAGTPVEPTCTEAGYTPYTCSVCGETKEDDAKDALGHDWVAGTAIEPTCTEKGYTPYTCSRCSETKQDDIKDALGHEWTYTEKDEENHTGTCSRCGDSVDEPHDWDKVEITKEPTKEETGEMTYTCSLCGATKVEEIPVLNDEQDMVAIMMTLRRAQEQILAKKRAAEAAKKAAEEAAKKAAEAAATPAKAPLPFTDVDTITNMYDIVEYVYDNGIMNGVSATEFDPYGNLTRGMIVTILHRLEGKPATAYTGTFTDVAADLWYTEGIEWAAANGIVNGYGDGTFGPNDDVTREQLAAILYRYAGFKGYKIRTEGFTSADLAAVSKWAAEAMDWAVANDVLWVSNTLVRPTEKALRWEVAVAVRALLEYVAK